jgi:Na+/H+-dicarboxylate symporter
MRARAPAGGGIVVALLAGIASGLLLHRLGSTAAARGVALTEPVGALWLNALRMTVLPLVVSLLITGVGGTARQLSAERLTARSLAAFAVLMPLFLSLWPVDPAAAAALRAGVGDAASHVPALPPLRDGLAGLVPANPFEAAATGAMLPLVVFALLFGFALARIEATRRDRLLEFFQALADTLFMIVRGVLVVAPVGVFALALGVGYRGGAGAAGAIGD